MNRNLLTGALILISSAFLCTASYAGDRLVTAEANYATAVSEQLVRFAGAIANGASREERRFLEGRLTTQIKHFRNAVKDDEYAKWIDARLDLVLMTLNERYTRNADTAHKYLDEIFGDSDTIFYERYLTFHRATYARENRYAAEKLFRLKTDADVIREMNELARLILQVL